VPRHILIAAWLGLVLAALARIAGLDRWYELSLEALLLALVAVAVAVQIVRRSPKEAAPGGAVTALVPVDEEAPAAGGRHQSEALLAGIVAACPDAILAVDAQQRITLFNRSAERVFGYTSAEAIGSPLSLLVPSRFRDMYREDVEHFAHGHGVNRPRRAAASAVARRKNGDEFPVEAAIATIEVDGAPVVTVVVRDISEHVRVETEQRFLADVGATLAATLDYEETLANIARLAVRDLADVCVVDVVEDDGRVRRVEVMGRAPRRGWLCELLRDAGLERDPPELVRTVLDTRRPLIVAPVSTETFARLSHDAGRQRALRSAGLTSIVVVPLLTHGTLLGAVTLIVCGGSRRPPAVHITEALAQRAALSMANARLLRETQRALKVRDDVLAIVSHDLRNPVATIGLLADLLRQADPATPARLAEFADDIQRSVEDMHLLIDDLLDFARIHSATFSVESHPYRLDAVVMPVIDRLRLLAGARHQTIDVDIPGDLPDVEVDVRRVRQVIANLVGNAIKFTGDGGAIRIEARPQGDLVTISVTDTGVGIAPEHLSRIFERFWQLPRTEHRGTGLGLSIAKGIVEAHGGAISAESVPGRGSTFTFTLHVADTRSTTADDEGHVLHGAG
jgi:PAS domain S-box-containing protein